MRMPNTSLGMVTWVIVTGAVLAIACSSAGAPSTSGNETSDGGTSGSSGTSGTLDTPDAGPEAGSGGKKGLAEGPCADSSVCESNECFVGGSGGGTGGQSYCSIRCTPATAALLCV